MFPQPRAHGALPYSGPQSANSYSGRRRAKMKVMKSRAVQLLSTALISVFLTHFASARDDQRVALTTKAQLDFDRVSLSVQPPLGDTATCAQSQAALLSISPPEDLAELHYRK